MSMLSATLTSAVPEIGTDRLVLRSFRAGDYQPYRDIMAEPKVFEHVGGKPLDVEEGMRRLCMYAGFWMIQGVGWDPLESTCRHASLSIL